MERLTQIAADVMSRHFGIGLKKARALYQLTSGLPFSEQLKVLYPHETKKNKSAASNFEKKKRENYFDEKVFPDTLKTLNHLKQKGYAVVISSNSAHELVEEFVTQLKLPCDFALGYKNGFSKGRLHFDYILKELCVNPSEMVFIGDSLKDGEWAFQCGVDFIAKEGTFTRKKFQEYFPGVPVISTLAELKNMF